MSKTDINLLLKSIFDDDVVDIRMVFDEKIKEYNLSKTKALKLLNIDKDVFEEIVSGTAKQPNLIHIIKIAEFLDQKAVLDKINPENTSAAIALGSFVKTNNMYLFVSAALPKITVDGATVIALSPQSPLGTKMMGMQAEDTFEVNGTNYLIQEII